MPEEKKIPNSLISVGEKEYNDWCNKNFNAKISNDYYTVGENNKQKGNSFVNKLTKQQLDANQNNNVQAAA